MITCPDIKQQITFMGTHDLEQSATFYREIIGLEVVLKQKDCVVFRITSNSFLGLCHRTKLPKDKAKIVVISMVTDDVDSWHAHLVSQGIRIHQELATNQDYQIYNFFIKDPDGYLLEFQKFLHPFE